MAEREQHLSCLFSSFQVSGSRRPFLTPTCAWYSALPLCPRNWKTAQRPQLRHQTELGCSQAGQRRQPGSKRCLIGTVQPRDARGAGFEVTWCDVSSGTPSQWTVAAPSS